MLISGHDKVYTRRLPFLLQTDVHLHDVLMLIHGDDLFCYKQMFTSMMCLCYLIHGDDLFCYEQTFTSLMISNTPLHGLSI